MIIRGIDTDNYDKAVSVQRFQNLHDNYDVRFNIVGCQVGDDGANYTKIQTENSIAAGLEVPFHYEFLYWDNTDLLRMKRAADFGLPVAIDVEVAKPANWSINQVIDRIHQAKNLLLQEGRYWGIYTGAWYWPAGTNNCKDFKDDNLWHAAYPFGEGVLPPETYLPDLSQPIGYGGWSTAKVMQYADVCYDETGFDMNAMISEESGVFVRHNAISAWYDDPNHQDFDSTDGSVGCNANADFGVGGQRAVEIEVYLKPKSKDLQVLDGSGAYAFTVPAKTGYGHGTVILLDDWFKFKGTGIKIKRVGCLGYYN